MRKGKAIWGVLIAIQGIGLAQDPDVQAERARMAMEPSLELQRDAVRRQEAAVSATAAGVHFAAVKAPVITMVAAAPASDCDPIPQPELSRLIREASRKAGVDTKLLREVARQESAFRPCAVSSKGAQGLMQLMPATQNLLAVDNPFDPQESLEAGSKLLKQLLDRYHGDISMALSAYNAGINCVDKAGGVPDIQETRNYVSNILSRLSDFNDSGALNLRVSTMPSSLLASGCQSLAHGPAGPPESPSDSSRNDQINDDQH